MFTPMKQQEDFGAYNIFLNKLAEDEFILYGKSTKFVPLIIKLDEIEMIDEINDTSSTVVRKKFKRLLDKRFPLHSFDEIIKVGKEIINIKSEESIKKKGKKYTFKF